MQLKVYHGRHAVLLNLNKDSSKVALSSLPTLLLLNICSELHHSSFVLTGIQLQITVSNNFRVHAHPLKMEAPVTGCVITPFNNVPDTDYVSYALFKGLSGVAHPFLFHKICCKQCLCSPSSEFSRDLDCFFVEMEQINVV